ncbi:MULTISPECIES: hypothetical protein [Ensifer]|uniref:hypothetical protein n=1 Tax=Ensifer TaxID=106591 RepID=UPI00159EC172|nr:hypothetical protein [Ensifer adhaerens]
MRIAIPLSLYGAPGTPLFDGQNYAAEAAGMVRFVGVKNATWRDQFAHCEEFVQI